MNDIEKRIPGERPAVKPLSEGLFFWSVLVSAGLGVALTVVAMAMMSARRVVHGGSFDSVGWVLTAMPPLLLGELAFLYAFILSLILWHRSWQAVQDGAARTTPGRAIGFLFIPFYNYYWIFVAVWGYAKEYNAFLARHRLPVQKVPEGLFMFYCIWTLAAIVCAFIPVVRFIAPFIGYVVWMACTWYLVRGVNALARA